MLAQPSALSAGDGVEPSTLEPQLVTLPVTGIKELACASAELVKVGCSGLSTSAPPPMYIGVTTAPLDHGDVAVLLRFCRPMPYVLFYSNIALHVCSCSFVQQTFGKNNSGPITVSSPRILGTINSRLKEGSDCPPSNFSKFYLSPFIISRLQEFEN